MEEDVVREVRSIKDAIWMAMLTKTDSKAGSPSPVQNAPRSKTDCIVVTEIS